MASAYKTANGRTMKRGLFLNSVWHCDCDCDPRLPADKFQTKNGGKNHGRWCKNLSGWRGGMALIVTCLVYTCQKPKHKGCKFFLWADEAKIREEAAVLNNSRSEPRTPQKQTYIAAPTTPQTRTNAPAASIEKSAVQAKAADALGKQDSFSWSSSDEEELLKAEQEVLQGTSFETPKKAARPQNMASPGKRTFFEMSVQSAKGDKTWLVSDDVFSTPSESHNPNRSALLTPSTSATSGPIQTAPLAPQSSTLATEALQILRKAKSQLDHQAETDLVELLNKHDLRTQGISKGRDLVRVAVQSRDRKIAELQSRISVLEAEKETNRRVISHLKVDLATPKKDGGRSMPRGRRSEV